MAQFKHIGGYTRDVLYPRAFTVEPGEVVEADENPDPAYFEPVAAESSNEEE